MGWVRLGWVMCEEGENEWRGGKPSKVGCVVVILSVICLNEDLLRY